MKPVIIEQGHGYKITSFGNGVSYLIHQEQSAQEVLISGDDASDWRAEYNDLHKSHGEANSRASRFTWRELLDTLCGPYFA